MPFTIPTYYASQFVKYATLEQRRKVLKSSYKTQYFLTSGFIFYNLKDIMKRNRLITQ